MGDWLAGILAGLTFVLILSLWNLMSKWAPGQPSGGMDWIVFLVAAIVAIVVYMQTSSAMASV